MSEHSSQKIMDMLSSYEPPFSYAHKHEPSIGLPDVQKKELYYYIVIDLVQGRDLSEIINRLNGDHYEDLVENFKQHGYSLGFNKLIYHVQAYDDRKNELVFEVIETLP